MTLTQWFIFFLVIQAIHFLGTWKLYVKAGYKAWEAAVPVYNAYILTKIINRHWSWVILLFIPMVNVIMLPIIWVETLRAFGKNKDLDTVLGVITLGFYIYYVNYFLDVEHIKDRSLQPKTKLGEWVSSILFAVVAATLVHTYVMQPYNIPTSSLEKTLLVGDFLFVSKFHYGARTPMTAVSFPMVHDTIPKTKVKSYLSKPQYPYFRLPGFQKIKRSDIVVFSWPTDTVNAFKPWGDGKHYYKPIDKKSNYVKRCVGLPGDVMSIVDGKIISNGKPLQLPTKAKPQYSYIVKGKGNGFNLKTLYKYLEITDPISAVALSKDPETNVDIIKQAAYEKGRQPYEITSPTNLYSFSALTEESAKKLRNHKNVVSVTREISPVGQREFKYKYDQNRNIIKDYSAIFPNNSKTKWNKDQIQDLYIPEEGKTVDITTDNIDLYKRIIEVYEGSEMGIENNISTSANQILLNNTPLTKYTFKQNYYWMMGDNRHNSEDSRYWGFVPETHIVGKPVFLFFSLDNNAEGIMNKIRWERLMSTVGGDGKLKSHKILVFILIGIYIIGSFIWERKKKKEA